MASYFGPRCDFILEAGSPPFTVFRNKEGHQLKPSFSTIATKNQYNLQAWQNTLYYKHNQQDFPVSSDVLYEIAKEDLQLQTDAERSCVFSSRNSVLGFHHEDQSLFVHTAGKCFDHLVLRYATDLQPGLVDLPSAHKPPPDCPASLEVKKAFGNTTGFILPLGGLQIEQVEAWGTNFYNTSTNLLARSAHSFYHVQTLDLRDSLPRLLPDSKEPIIPQFWAERPIILDPVQKWDLTRGTVRAMCGSQSSSASCFFLLEDRGQHHQHHHAAVLELHTLCPQMGPRRVLAPGVSVFPESGVEAEGGARGRKEVAMASLAHPQLCLLSRGDALFVKDLREAASCHLLVNAPFPITSLLSLQETNSSSTTSTSSESFSLRSDNYLLMGQEEDVFLMDLRYTRSSLAQRPVPGGTHFMRNATLPVRSQAGGQAAGCGERDVVLTAGVRGQQLYTHHMHLSHSSASNRQQSRSEAHFLQSGGVFGGSAGGVSWESAGWPVIDRASDTRSLRGVGLLPLPPSVAHTDRQDISNDDQAERGERDGGRALEELLGRCQGVVVQQSDTGDVFAQYLQCLSVGEDEGDGGDAGRQGQEVWASGRRVEPGSREARSKEARSRVEKAPIQIDLPIGVRCPAFPDGEKAARDDDDVVDQNGQVQRLPSDTDASYHLRARRGLMRLNDRGKRSTGLGVRGALLPQDGDLNVYPLGQVNFVPHLEEREIKRASVLMLEPEEIHLEADHNMRSDPTIKVVKVPYRILDWERLAGVVVEHQQALFSALARKFMTLFELWEWFVEQSGFDCDIEQLRQVMLCAIHLSKTGARGGFSTPVEVMVIPPPPPSHYASADGLKMAYIQKEDKGADINHAPVVQLCNCHDAVLRYLQQQRRNKHASANMSGTCESVDELTESTFESDLSMDLDSLSTCSQPSCLLLHCLGFKLSGQAYPEPEPLQRIAPSCMNPKHVAEVQAQRDRVEAVREAQSRTHVQVSDVTLELMDQLKGDWGAGDSD